MNRIALAAVVLVALVVAVFALLSPPDTGAAIPDAPTARSTAPQQAAPQGSPAFQAPRPAAPMPDAHPIEARRQENDAMLVGSLGSAWTAIKRDLSGNLTEEQMAAVRPELEAIIQGFRDARRSPDNMDLPGLRSRQNAMRKRLVDEGLVTPLVSAQLLRLDALEQQYPVE